MACFGGLGLKKMACLGGGVYWCLGVLSRCIVLRLNSWHWRKLVGSCVEYNGKNGYKIEI